MDLTIDVEDYKLNVRAAGVIIHNNKLLTHRNVNSDHYALVGGRVEIGEDSATTVKREIKEELGKDVEITGYIATVENFFEMNGSKYHEILFIHQVEFIDEQDKKIENDLKNVEGKDYLKYEWKELDKIDEYPLFPEEVKNILKENKFPVHVINRK
jgi:ADP-ribose pyrophosphatase YjhB (NUDIX family)